MSGAVASSVVSALADPDLILTQLLARLAGDLVVFTEMPADYLDRLPCSVVVAIPAAAAPEPGLQIRAGIQVDSFAEAGRREAYAQCAAVVAALEAAWHGQVVVPAGHVRRLALSTGPTEIRTGDSPSGTWRFTARLVAIFRPPT